MLAFIGILAILKFTIAPAIPVWLVLFPVIGYVVMLVGLSGLWIMAKFMDAWREMYRK